MTTSNVRIFIADQHYPLIGARKGDWILDDGSSFVFVGHKVARVDFEAITPQPRESQPGTGESSPAPPA